MNILKNGYAIVSITLFFSCSNNATEKSVDSALVDERKMIQESFPEYWKRFQKTIISKPKDIDLKNFVIDSLKINGFYDSYPVLMVYGGSLSKAIKLYNVDNFSVSKDSLSFFNKVTDLDILIAEKLDNDYDSISTEKSGDCRINNLIFARTKEGWKLVCMYLNTEDLSRFSGIQYILIKPAGTEYDLIDESVSDTLDK